MSLCTSLMYKVTFDVCFVYKVPLQQNVSLSELARGTPGFSGADLSNLMNQAALRASSLGQRTVRQKDIEHAKDRILMGVERVSAVLSSSTIRTTAYHEAGHAIVAIRTAGADPVHKATIMPRGRALGLVMQLPEGDQTSLSRKQMLARLDVCMGGRVAEELVFGHENVTSGASGDIQQATRLARAMVTQYGFGDSLGFLYTDGVVSSETQKEVDTEVRKILTDSYSRARNLLTSSRHELDVLAHELARRETLTGLEINQLLEHHGTSNTNGVSVNNEKDDHFLQDSANTLSKPSLPVAV